MKVKLNKKFLKNYLNSYGPSGFEYELGTQKIWIDYISKFSKNVNIDSYGNSYAILGDMDSGFKVVIEAHSDEISWIVNYIDSKGYIKVIRNGGSDATIAPSMNVILWGDKGPINGIFGHPAIHIQNPDNKINLDSIFIDIGASSKNEVIDRGINIGTVITYDSKCMELGNNFYTGRALDNRIGGFIIAEVARYISENEIKLPYKLYIVNSVQEEVGLKGAKMIANKIKPNIAIITDVCHDTSSPVYNPAKQGEIIAGNGPVILSAPSIHNKLRRKIIKNAKDNKINYQLLASSNRSGTDTDEFAYSNSGVPSALISIPLKYMHTTVETAHKKDVKNTVKLFLNLLKNIENNEDFRYDR